MHQVAQMQNKIEGKVKLKYIITLTVDKRTEWDKW